MMRVRDGICVYLSRRYESLENNRDAATVFGYTEPGSRQMGEKANTAVT